MNQKVSEKDQTKNNIIEGINYHRMWKKFEDAVASYKKSPWSYESVLFGLKEIEEEVNIALDGLENKRKKDYQYIKNNLQFCLGNDRITDYAWILSLLFVKRTMDMIWLKSNDEKREVEKGKYNCEWHKKLLIRYCKILNDLSRSYVDNKKDEDTNMTLVFQYGSNCLESEMNSPERFNGKAIFLGVAKTVENYQLDFNTYGRRRECAVADIIKSGNKPVWGVLYNIPNELMCRETAPNNLISFDKIEGEGCNYRRHWLPIIRLDGKKLIALTYVVRCPYQRPIKTNTEYAQLIISGLREHIKDGIPSEYINEVKQIIGKNNPKINVNNL